MKTSTESNNAVTCSAHGRASDFSKALSCGGSKGVVTDLVLGKKSCKDTLSNIKNAARGNNDDNPGNSGEWSSHDKMDNLGSCSGKDGIGGR
jgi:hypothetical protein